MGKANNKSPTKSNSPIEYSNNEFSLEITQDTDPKRTIIDILKVMKRENDEIRNEVETLKRSHAEMKL